jgi:hypothetical protein
MIIFQIAYLVSAVLIVSWFDGFEGRPPWQMLAFLATSIFVWLLLVYWLDNLFFVRDFDDRRKNSK